MLIGPTALINNQQSTISNQQSNYAKHMDWAHLRLQDRIAPGVRVLFVGINPGVRSAETGHHFAGYSNRFWKLLTDSRLVGEPITYLDDVRLPEFGFGITNLIARPSPGIGDLRPAEYVDGWKTLERKIRRYKPEIVALVGVTLFRAIEPLLAGELDKNARAALKSRRIDLGLQDVAIHGARVFVLPNPSGRNANFSYAEMLAAFVALQRVVQARVEAGLKGGLTASTTGQQINVRRRRPSRADGASERRAAGGAGRSRRGA
jgi:TDG/mug DNA glycosylase family protein